MGLTSINPVSIYTDSKKLKNFGVKSARSLTIKFYSQNLSLTDIIVPLVVNKDKILPQYVT